MKGIILKRKIASLFWFVLPALVVCACKNADQTFSGASDERLHHVADSLAQKYILTDGHVDLPYRLQIKWFRLQREHIGIPLKSSEGDFDLERAKKGGLDAPFMSIYIPSTYQLVPDNGKAYADSLITMVEEVVHRHPDHFALARTPEDIVNNTGAGKISLPMGMENGAPIGDDLKNVEYFFNRGIRYITLTHRTDNQISDSSYDTLNHWKGISPFGEKVIGEMNRLGMMVDVSHISDSAFYDVIRITKAPCIASHSSCRKFTPGFQRNMDDDMIKALAKNGGVIQINFGAAFIDSVARTNEVLRDSLENILKRQGITSADEKAQPVIEAFGKQHRELYSEVERVADHIDHVVKLVGIDHVGIGSDFDGVGDSLPLGLKDVSQYPNLIFILLKRGYSARDIEKICSGNVFRVWNAVIATAN